MARQRKKELVRCEFFEWRVGMRQNGYYYADGRSNKVDAGRYSLGTADREQAMTTLKRLDREAAVRFGLAPSAMLNTATAEPLGLDLGTKLYLGFVARPAVAGGASAGTQKRYRPVFEKFGRVMKENGIRSWLQVNEAAMDLYAGWLEDNEYEYATQYLELTTIKQAVNWLVDKKHLPESCRFEYPLKSPDGTDTYCYTYAEVSAMVEHCLVKPELQWLGEVIVGLAHTGLRISELAALRWTDIDFAAGFIRLADGSRRGTREERAKARTTKGRRERALPLHSAFRDVLGGMSRHADGKVFHGSHGGMLKPDKVRKALIRDVLTPLTPRFPAPAGGTGLVDGRLHSFRHYFCSMCANRGVPEQMLMNWLGNRDSNMVKRYYHASREEAQRVMEQIRFAAGPQVPAGSEAKPGMAGGSSPTPGDGQTTPP